MRAASRARGLDDLRRNRARLERIFEQELFELLVDDRLDDAFHLARDELVLRLRRELGIGHLHRKHRNQALAHVVARERDLGGALDAGGLDVVRERARQRGAKAGEMRAAVLLRNVVREAERRFLVRVGPLHRDVDGGAFVLGRERDDLLVQRRLQLREVLDERADAAFVLERVVLLRALVGELDLDARVQERQLAEPLRQNVIVKFCICENCRARVEAHRRAATIRGADDFQRIFRLAEAVFLAMLVAVAVDRQRQLVRQRIDDRNADAVQAA